jgi:nucleotide-binding universal stress UspA family protein
MLEKAETTLRESAATVGTTTRFGFADNVDTLVSEILEAARAEGCDTIVVGREVFTGLDKIFRRHVADDLIRRGAGHTLWVVA